MIDLTKLSQEQLWGLAFATKQWNEGKEVKLSEQEYANKRFSDICNDDYKALLNYKTQMALAMFQAMSPEQQAALIAQLGIPDVL